MERLHGRNGDGAKNGIIVNDKMDACHPSSNLGEELDLPQIIKANRRLTQLPPVPWQTPKEGILRQPLSEELKLILDQKFSLPLTTQITRVASFDRDKHGSPLLLCWEDDTSFIPKFTISLPGAYVINNITENGPCMYIISRDGEFEFQCTDQYQCGWWTRMIVSGGAHHLNFSDIYEIVRTIGSGSFAKVYLGLHRVTGEEIVIKAVKKSKHKKSSAYTEIEVLRKMAHPFVIRLYAAYEAANHICLVLEYVRGGELFACLTANGPLTEFNARAAMHRVLLALQYMHANGIVHRDLKTENLILEHPSCPWAVKLIDYGLASTLEKDSMKMRCGSPGYVAPEILQDKPYNTKVDVFSAGVIMYALLTGTPPFKGHNVTEILNKNLKCQLEFPEKYFGNVGFAAQDLLRWMCSKDPNNRCSAFEALSHPWLQPVPNSPRNTIAIVNTKSVPSIGPVSRKSKPTSCKNGGSKSAAPRPAVTRSMSQTPGTWNLSLKQQRNTCVA